MIGTDDDDDDGGGGFYPLNKNDILIYSNRRHSRLKMTSALPLLMLPEKQVRKTVQKRNNIKRH